jgi:chromosome segregation ATPase
MSGTVLSNDVKDAQTVLTLLESSILKIESGTERLAKKRPELKDELNEAKAAVVKAYKNLLALDASLNVLENFIDFEPKKKTKKQEEDEWMQRMEEAHERDLQEEQAYADDLEKCMAGDSSSSSSSSEEEEEEEVVFPAESYKTPVKMPGRKLNFGTGGRFPFYTPQKKRGRRLSFGK